ncbi:YhfT family protein [Paenactinomyces guangxiensis]|uniref:YhfT family protein n=1 Tax=Paenactinomyces guangxiensis TaxID=1490290 RepID=A0A7W2A761_9BACL|nr:YhfT family protein [Paenactinomyces guangxiensis]MBA4493220.1 YhfT family protein [Paenactinomyces guangxiensis]MBH8589930.1 YhfT family protein [Paenactinomyces guangxiensis]
MTELILATLVGAMAALLANRNIAVFNDGLRPILPENIEGRMDRRTLALTSFAMSFGLVIGFGIPFSLTAKILLIHSILLGTDMIGLSLPSNRWGNAGAAVVGGIYGAGLSAGLDSIVNIFKMLPVDVLKPLEQVGAPVVVGFMAFPALAVALQFSIKKGIVTFAVSALARQLAVWCNEQKLLTFGQSTVTLNQEGVALITGMIFLIIFAIRQKKPETDGSSPVDLAAIFSERVNRIRKQVVFFMMMGGVIAAAANLLVLAGDPISLQLLSEGNRTDAALAAAARAVGFIPLIASTAIATGVYSPVGFTFIFVAGLLAPNPWLAGILGCVIIFIEVFLLSSVSRFLDRYPGVREAGENIRTAMTRLLEVALLIGGANAANMMAPGLGYFLIGGFYVLNEAAGRPVVRMAIGPIGAIVTGIIANLLVASGLMSPPLMK